VHVAAGSVSLLYQFTGASAGPGDEVVYAWRSFEAYPGMVLVSGATSVTVPNGPGDRHDIDGILAAVTDRTRLVIICSPNNPTGSAVTAAEFERLMAALPRDLLVILDEAYHEFVTDPAAVNGFDYLQDGRLRYPNLVVLRTFSKAYGLAGLRIGYAVGAPALLAAARATAIPLQVTDAAQQAALASLDARDALFERVAEITARRDALVAGLRALGLDVPDAQGNFIWIPYGGETAALADRYDAAGLTVRAFAGDGMRISVGEHESVDLLLRISTEIVRDLPSDHRALTVR
jgi:histidinol-phosphate aminotransferase